MKQSIDLHLAALEQAIKAQTKALMTACVDKAQSLEAVLGPGGIWRTSNGSLHKHLTKQLLSA
jgi:hypothetical protein